MDEPIVVLEHFGVTDLSLKIEGDLEAMKSVTNNIEFGFGIEPQQKHGRYKVGLQFKNRAISSEGQPIHSLSVHMVGFFQFPEGIPEPEHERILKSNGLSMLYSSLRGAILTVSGCFPPGFKYILPTVNIASLVGDIEAQKAALEASGSEAAVPGQGPERH